MDVDAPPANFRLDAVGRSRQGRLIRCGGPSQVEESHADAAAIACEPSRMHSRTAKWTIRLQYRILAWRSPPNGDRRCPSHPSHQVRPNVRGTTLTDNSDSQFPVPQRGRKRLSREAILRTELALEWLELVQIGRCKVRWLLDTAKKRNLTSFYSEKTIYTTLPPPGGSFDPETISQYSSIFDGVVALDHLL